MALEKKKQTLHRRPSQGGLMKLPESVLAHVYTFLNPKTWVNSVSSNTGKTALIEAIDKKYHFESRVNLNNQILYQRLLDTLLQAGA